jgi:hypothetical protein
MPDQTIIADSGHVRTRRDLIVKAEAFLDPSAPSARPSSSGSDDLDL